MSEQVSSGLLNRLESLLDVLNPDEDNGGYFICEEAETSSGKPGKRSEKYLLQNKRKTQKLKLIPLFPSILVGYMTI